jgi:hypothetical protein
MEAMSDRDGGGGGEKRLCCPATRQSRASYTKLLETLLQDTCKCCVAVATEQAVTDGQSALPLRISRLVPPAAFNA